MRKNLSVRKVTFSPSGVRSFKQVSRIMTKPAKWHVRPAKTQISLGIHPVWSESLLSAWRKLGSLATHWVHSKDSDQTEPMLRLIWVFAGRTVILLVLSWHSSCMLIHSTGGVMAIGLKLPLAPYIVFSNSQDSGETVMWMHRLALESCSLTWAFAACLHHIMW